MERKFIPNPAPPTENIHTFATKGFRLKLRLYTCNPLAILFGPTVCPLVISIKMLFVIILAASDCSSRTKLLDSAWMSSHWRITKKLTKILMAEMVAMTGIPISSGAPCTSTIFINYTVVITDVRKPAKSSKAIVFPSTWFPISTASSNLA